MSRWDVYFGVRKLACAFLCDYANGVTVAKSSRRSKLLRRESGSKLPHSKYRILNLKSFPFFYQITPFSLGEKKFSLFYGGLEPEGNNFRGMSLRAICAVHNRLRYKAYISSSFFYYPKEVLNFQGIGFSKQDISDKFTPNVRSGGQIPHSHVIKITLSAR